MTPGEPFQPRNFNCKILNQKIEFLKITPHGHDHVCSALLNSFLGRFRRIITCWKGIESRNLDQLQVITSCKALHVMPYKKENIVEKTSQIS